MTVCNMSIEAGARAGMVAPDDITFDYMKGRAQVPQGQRLRRSCGVVEPAPLGPRCFL